MRFIDEPNLVRLSYPAIFYFWSKFLWKDRITPIPSVSHMTLDRSFSDKISDSIYYGMILKDKIIGVNSVHQIEDTVRSRGLWVNPEFRKRGFGVELLEYGIMMAEGTTVWSYPRIEAVGVYKRAGFTVCSEEIVDNIDHKVNIYVKHETDNSLI